MEFLLNDDNSASVHRQKCLCGNRGIQHHTPRDPEGVLPTHASGSRHTDLGPSCRPCSGLWTISSPFWPWLRSPWRILSEDNHGWEDLCRSLGFQQRSSSTSLEKKKQNKTRSDTPARIRGTVRLYPSPKALRTCKWEFSFPSCVGLCQRGPFLSHHIQSIEL